MPCLHQTFLSRVKTFKEINMNFLATEASAFHLDMPRCIPRLFTSRWRTHTRPSFGTTILLGSQSYRRCVICDGVSLPACVQA